MALQRSQLRLVQVYRVRISGQPDMRAVIAERFEGPDGFDRARLVREWTIEGHHRRFSISIPRVMADVDVVLWSRFEVHARVTREEGRFNETVRTLVDREELSDIPAEFIILRRDESGERLEGMRRVDIPAAEFALVQVARRLNETRILVGDRQGR
ncbi:hypothetical protein C8T65DRAFT_700230 [Cerioporus squamosus]|nr:hypothetical protein C8T65DRAFT_700230 [Cerioporus squamosus]